MLIILVKNDALKKLRAFLCLSFMKEKYLIVILFCYSSLFSQNYLEYYKLINKAEISNLDKNYLKSDSLYQEAFHLVKKPFKEDFYLAAINSEKIKDANRTYHYLKFSLEKGLDFDRIRNEKFKNFKNSSFWKKLKKEKKEIETLYLSNINVSLRNQISEMIKNDQKARQPIFGSWKKMKRIDSYNFKKLLSIIEENDDKWPGFSLIGENTPKGKYDVAGNIALMLLHFRKEEIKVLMPYMQEAIFNGEMYPYHYARIIDYKYFGNAIKITKESNGEKKITTCNNYGTYLNTSICDCDRAEKERKKIGFEPLKDYYIKRKSKFKCLK